MPTFQLRRQPVWVAPKRFVLRGRLSIVRRTLSTSGGAFAQAQIRVFSSSAMETLVARDESDPLGVYGVSVPDGAAYFVVATQPATFDSTFLTWDNTGAKFDRTKGVGGVSETCLRGSAG